MTSLGFLFSHILPLGPLGLILAVSFAGLGFAVGLGLARGGAGGKTGEARRQWARRLADASFDGLLVHRNGTILQMNRALVRMLGYREVELLGTHFSNLAAADRLAEMRTELEAPGLEVAGFTLMHADGTERFVEMASYTLEMDGLPATVTAIRNVTAQRMMESRLAYLMHNDPLTGLANPAMFSDRLQEAVTRNDSAGGTTAVLTMELETLKTINALIGRRGGDILLRHVANRLTSMADESDTVARLAGNHFAIVQPHTGAPNRTAILTSQIETAMEEPFIVEGRAIRASMAIGVATYPEHATSAEGLINASGFALGQAIEKGGTHSFSHAEAAVAGFAGAVVGARGAAAGSRMLSLEEQRLAHDLRLAIPRGEITLEYQPVFDGRHLDVIGYEALARWRHPKDGMIPPGKFIPLADETGLAGTLGSFIMESACAEAARSKAPMMAINISGAQFRDPHLAGRIRDILQRTGWPANRLEAQVTEAMVMENPRAAAQALRAIQGIGVALTLDDFGTNFSSLSSLADFPFSRVKIDKKYIHQLEGDGNAQAVILAILSLARSLNIGVTAEGVESQGQLSFLQEKDCNYVQGYFLGRPASQAVSPQPPSQPVTSLPATSLPATSLPAASLPAASLAALPSLVATKR